MGWKNLLGPFVTQQELEPRCTWLDVVLNQINWDSDSELAKIVKNILTELHIKVLGRNYSL
jgi:ABC-type proline/glycine betaine transport system substrate-binding protein